MNAITSVSRLIPSLAPVAAVVADCGAAALLATPGAVFCTARAVLIAVVFTAGAATRVGAGAGAGDSLFVAIPSSRLQTKNESGQPRVTPAPARVVRFDRAYSALVASAVSASPELAAGAFFERFALGFSSPPLASARASSPTN